MNLKKTIMDYLKKQQKPPINARFTLVKRLEQGNDGNHQQFEAERGIEQFKTL